VPARRILRRNDGRRAAATPCGALGMKTVSPPEPDALIAAWTERREERLLRGGARAARWLEGWVHEMTDAEFLGLVVVVDKERLKRGDLF
jgi:hypothetical protein